MCNEFDTRSGYGAGKYQSVQSAVLKSGASSYARKFSMLELVQALLADKVIVGLECRRTVSSEWRKSTTRASEAWPLCSKRQNGS